MWSRRKERAAPSGLSWNWARDLHLLEKLIKKGVELHLGFIHVCEAVDSEEQLHQFGRAVTIVLQGAHREGNVDAAVTDSCPPRSINPLKAESFIRTLGRQ